MTCCSKEAHKSINDINKYRTTKYKCEKEIDHVNSDVESNADIFDENYKLEGRIFIDSPFFKRYILKLCDLKNIVQDNNVKDNKYYAPEIADYITNHYMPFAPMWSALLLQLVTPGTIRLSNANVESFFNIVKKMYYVMKLI